MSDQAVNDYLIRLGGNDFARRGMKALGLPTPRPLAREQGAYVEQPLKGKRVLLGAAGAGPVADTLRTELTAAGADIVEQAAGDRYDGLVFDATTVASVADLKALYRFFHPVMRSIAPNGRVVVLTAVPEEADTPAAAACRRGIEGFTRSMAKEIGKFGANVNLLYVAKGAEDRLAAPLRFFLSARSAYVDGQAPRVTAQVKKPAAVPLTQTLAGKVAVVTGAARGIGEATAARLAAEGAHVVGIDIPSSDSVLEDGMARIGGTALRLDITAEDAPQRLVDFLREEFGGVDVVVHNAGITRDKTLANMSEQQWDMVLAINLDAILRLDEQLVGGKVLRDEGRIVCLSSMGGIAGNNGQTNYGATKAALIGYVAAQAEQLAERGICVNAAAPGFIETRMTDAMPFMIREAGRRLNSLSQGGKPQDVAELVTFLSTPGACGITGQVIRVCGQSLIGA